MASMLRHVSGKRGFKYLEPTDTKSSQPEQALCAEGTAGNLPAAAAPADAPAVDAVGQGSRDQVASTPPS